MNKWEDFFKENLEKLDKIKKFENNWNGYGAKPFNPVVIQKAKDFLLDLYFCSPEIFPVADGSIQFELNNYFNGDFFEFVINKDEEIQIYEGNEKNRLDNNWFHIINSEAELITAIKNFIKKGDN